MEITDEYINDLFKYCDFGEQINKSVDMQRMFLANELRKQMSGFWSGRTSYDLMLRGGLLIDDKSETCKTLTLLGEIFMKEEGAQS